MRALLRNKDGHTAIEYGMIAALIAILLITSITTMGTEVEAMFDALLVAFE